MALVEWKDDFETGFASADYEHRKLIELINELYEGLGKSPEPAAAVAVLEEITARLASHFSIEEDAMRDRKYDEFEIHHSEHQRLIGDIRELAGKIAAGGAIPETLSGRLEDWFSAHFHRQDSRLHRFLDRAG